MKIWPRLTAQLTLYVHHKTGRRDRERAQDIAQEAIARGGTQEEEVA